VLYYPETLFFRFWYSFLLEAEETKGSTAAGKIRKIEEIYSPHQVSNPLSSGM
jgi:hypothetical protein